MKKALFTIFSLILLMSIGTSATAAEISGKHWGFFSDTKWGTGRNCGAKFKITVQKGDTLSSIARQINKRLGVKTVVTWKALWWQNKDYYFLDPGRIIPGQRIWYKSYCGGHETWM